MLCSAGAVAEEQDLAGRQQDGVDAGDVDVRLRRTTGPPPGRAGRHQAAGRRLRRAEVGGQPARLAARPPVLQGVGAAQDLRLDAHELGLGDARTGRDAVRPRRSGAAAERGAPRGRRPPSPAAIPRRSPMPTSASPSAYCETTARPEPSPLRLVAHTPRDGSADSRPSTSPKSACMSASWAITRGLRGQRRPAPPSAGPGAAGRSAPCRARSRRPRAPATPGPARGPRPPASAKAAPKAAPLAAWTATPATGQRRRPRDHAPQQPNVGESAGAPGRAPPAAPAPPSAAAAAAPAAPRPGPPRDRIGLRRPCSTRARGYPDGMSRPPSLPHPPGPPDPPDGGQRLRRRPPAATRLEREGAAAALHGPAARRSWRRGSRPGTEVVRGDVLDPASLDARPRRRRHGLLPGPLHGLRHATTARPTGAGANFGAGGRGPPACGRIVYLGGLGHGADLSPHLASRQEVGRTLAVVGRPDPRAAGVDRHRLRAARRSR